MQKAHIVPDLLPRLFKNSKPAAWNFFPPDGCRVSLSHAIIPAMQIEMFLKIFTWGHFAIIFLQVSNHLFLI